MVSGQHHHASPQHLHQYANQAAWLEDHRRETNGALASRALGLAGQPELEWVLAAELGVSRLRRHSLLRKFTFERKFTFLHNEA